MAIPYPPPACCPNAPKVVWKLKLPCATPKATPSKACHVFYERRHSSGLLGPSDQMPQGVFPISPHFKSRTRLFAFSAPSVVPVLRLKRFPSRAYRRKKAHHPWFLMPTVENVLLRATFKLAPSFFDTNCDRRPVATPPPTPKTNTTTTF